MNWLDDWIDRLLFGTLLVFMLAATIWSSVMLALIISILLEKAI
jgi:hypothetical protein